MLHKNVIVAEWLEGEGAAEYLPFARRKLRSLIDRGPIAIRARYDYDSAQITVERAGHVGNIHIKVGEPEYLCWAALPPVNGVDRASTFQGLTDGHKWRFKLLQDSVAGTVDRDAGVRNISRVDDKGNIVGVYGILGGDEFVVTLYPPRGPSRVIQASAASGLSFPAAYLWKDMLAGGITNPMAGVLAAGENRTITPYDDGKYMFGVSTSDSAFTGTGASNIPVQVIGDTKSISAFNFAWNTDTFTDGAGHTYRKYLAAAPIFFGIAKNRVIYLQTYKWGVPSDVTGVTPDYKSQHFIAASSDGGQSFAIGDMQAVFTEMTHEFSADINTETFGGACLAASRFIYTADSAGNVTVVWAIPGVTFDQSKFCIRIFISTDFGASWTYVTIAAQDSDFITIGNIISVPGALYMFYGTESATVNKVHLLKSADQGISWTDISPTAFNSPDWGAINDLSFDKTVGADVYFGMLSAPATTPTKLGYYTFREQDVKPAFQGLVTDDWSQDDSRYTSLSLRFKRKGSFLPIDPAYPQRFA